jgi:pimeloyl-ACP methyl ester carboxylesterase
MPASPPAALVVLVHGTWGRGFFPGLRNRAWLPDDSPLHRMLIASVGQRVRIKQFNWPGANSSLVRRAWGIRLALQIQDWLVDEPGTPVYLVGHSHGGTVALVAASDPRVRSHVQGIACLSTPFIRARRRHFGRLHTVLPALLGQGASALSVAGLWALSSTSPSILALLGLYVVSGLATFTLLLFLHAFADRVVDSFAIADLSGIPIRIIRRDADEASLALTAGQACSWLLNRVSILWLRLTHPYAIVDAIDRHWLSRVTVLSLVAAGAVHLRLHPIVGGEPSPIDLGSISGVVVELLTLLILFCLTLGVAVATSLAAGLLFLPVTMLFLWAAGAAMLLPFGLEAAAMAVLIEVTAESQLSGDWLVSNLGFSESSLAHETYSDPASLALLRDWFSRQADIARAADRTRAVD